MTKKRFTLEMQYWMGNPQGRMIFDNLTGQDGMSVEELCNIASGLHSECEGLESVLQVYADSLNKLEEENKELKKKVGDKEVAVEVETCKLMERVFALIDKKIREYSNREQRERTSNDIIGILKELKKELRE